MKPIESRNVVWLAPLLAVWFTAQASASAEDGPLTLENVPPVGENRADEPIRGEFSLDAAVHFLDVAALNWQKERKCFACHTDYAFLFTRPLVPWKTPAHEAIRSKAEYLAEHPRDVKYRVTEAVMVASVLAQNDALTTGKLHLTTRKALDRMWTMQREDGGFDWMKYNQPPSEFDDHYGVTMAAIGVGAAPDDYAETPAAKAGLDKIREYFKNNPPTNLHQRAMLLLASLNVAGIMTDAERRQVVQDLFALQKPDGGWGLATLGDWERSDGKLQDRESSDGYGTGFAVYVLRQAGVPADERRIQQGIGWLKSHQRLSGRWFTRSLWKDQKHYLTHAGTACAILALAACGETARNGEGPVKAADHVQPQENNASVDIMSHRTYHASHERRGQTACLAGRRNQDAAVHGGGPSRGWDSATQAAAGRKHWDAAFTPHAVDRSGVP